MRATALGDTLSLASRCRAPPPRRPPPPAPPAGGAGARGWRGRAGAARFPGVVVGHSGRGAASRPVTAATGAAVAPATPDAGSCITLDEVYAIARARGMALSMTTFGPFFKVTCSPVDVPSASEADLVGVLEGFVAPPPFGILHLDSVRVYNSRLRGPLRARAQTAFGLALLIGAVAFVHADAQGCSRAELLAIDDGNEYAERLVKYYARLGFAPIRAVGGNGLRDLPDLLVWGGAGMRMDADVQTLLKRWTRALRRSTKDEAT